MVEVGQVISGKYRLLRLLGDGGMGSVYEAEHLNLGTRVAIKVLHADLARRTGIAERFLQEARVSAQIRSPHVVQVTDVDRMHSAVEVILRSGVPMLLIRGQMSDLVSQERADEFLARFPQVEFADVRGAGHMVAGDRNDIFASAVIDFLTRHVDDE